MDEFYQNMNDFEKPISLLNVFNAIFRRRRIILAVFVLAIVAGTVLTFLLPPVYRGSAQLLLERDPESEKALLFRMTLPDGQARFDWVSTEIEIIKSHPIAVQVVRALSLDRLEEGGASLSEAERSRRFEKAVERFKKNLSIDRIQNSSVIEIGYEDNDPHLVVKVVEEVIDTYLNHRSEIYDESETYRFFDEQMQIANEKLRGLEEQEAAYQQEKGVVSPEGQTDILLARLAEYEESLTAARTRRIGKETKLAVIKEQLRNGGELRIPSIESSDGVSRTTYISKLKGDLLEMEIERERLLQTFTPQYKEIVDLDKTIEITRTKIKEEIDELIEMEEASIQAIQAEERMLRSMIDETRKEMLGFVQDKHELDQLSRGIGINQEVYSMFLKQREEARISLAKLERGVKIKIISKPYVAPDPVKPEKAKNVLLSIFLGLFGGLALAYALNYFDHSITTPKELEDLTGLHVLGSIREIDLNGKGRQTESKETVSSK